VGRKGGCCREAREVRGNSVGQSGTSIIGYAFNNPNDPSDVCFSSCMGKE
jgi:hypothetical protein